MKKLFLVLSFFLITNHVLAQSIQIGLGGGLTYVLGSSFYKKPLYAKFDKTGFDKYALIDLSGLDFNQEYHLSLKFRLVFDQSPISLYSEVNYNSLTGNGSILIFTPRANPFPPKPINVKSNATNINTCLGIEYKLLKKSIIPILSGGIAVNYLSEVKIESLSGNWFKYTVLKERVRFGIAGGIGLDYRIQDNLTIGISARYIMNNLFSKNDLSEELNTLTLGLFVFYSF